MTDVDVLVVFFFSSRRRHTRFDCDWSSDVCSSDLQKAYAQLSDEILFDKQWVKVEVLPEDLPGFKGPRVVCTQCGEGINFKREVIVGGLTLCRSCAGEKYYQALA